MKTIIAFAALLAVAFAVQEVKIVSYEQDILPEGSHHFKYETDDGTAHEAHGDVTKGVVGSYKYISPDGTPIEVTYAAGEQGYVATGSHIPVAPEIPSHIIRALEYIRTHPQKEETITKH